MIIPLRVSGTNVYICARRVDAARPHSGSTTVPFDPKLAAVAVFRRLRLRSLPLGEDLKKNTAADNRTCQ